MGLLRVWLLLALFPLLGGCPSIYSEQPLGEVVALKPEEVNGPWIGIEISVVDAANGVIAINKHSCEPLPPSQSEEFLMQIRMKRTANGKEWYFPIGIESREQIGSQAKLASLIEYHVFFLRTEPGVVFGYELVVDRFKSLVEKGALPGRVEGKKVILGPLSPEHYEVLLSEEQPLVAWQRPSAYLLKVSLGLDPCTKGEKSK